MYIDAITGLGPCGAFGSVVSQGVAKGSSWVARGAHWIAQKAGPLMEQTAERLTSALERVVARVSGTKTVPTGALANVPGRVQSRINLMTGSVAEGKGWLHVVDRHFNPSKKASQFTISQNELRSLLQSKRVVQTPVTGMLNSAGGNRFVGEVTFDVPIGLDKYSGFQPTSKMTVLTDKFGNLVTATPGVNK
jgi:hypothetical protein